MSPKDETCSVNIPAFLSKLWKIVNDPEIDNIISWSPDGRSFVIQDQAQFWYNILPIYYKHNNMSSFVRQLNMYGFHKIHADGKDREHDELKFYHPFFRKNQPSLMKNIKRKITTTHRTPAKTELAETTTQQVTNLNHMTKVLVDVKQLQTRQESVDNQLASMKKENAALWRELALLRQKHMKQQQLVNKLIHFLVHIVNPSRGNMGGMGRKRKFPLMINDIASSSKSQKTTDSSSSDDGIIIHEVENEYILPNEKPEDEFEEHEEEEEEEALINSPENITMDSTDEFLDIPMTDEVVDSPDSLCPDNILAEDPNIENIEPEAEALEVPEEEPPLLTAASIDINDLIPSPTQIASMPSPSLSTVEAMFPNMSSVPETEIEVGEQLHAIEDKSKKTKKKKKKSGKSKDKSISTSTSTSTSTSASASTSNPNLKLNLTVATRNSNSNNNSNSNSNAIAETSKAITLNSPDDFENHLEATQEELDSIKELLLDGYALDPNTVLNLNSSIFTDMPLQLFLSDDNLSLPSAQMQAQTQAHAQNIPSTSTSTSKTNDNDLDFSCDPMVSGTGAGNELMPYNMSSINTNASTSNLLDFENLFENETSPESTMDPSMELMDLVNMADNQSTLNTPVQIKIEPPSFPSSSSSSSPYNISSNNNRNSSSSNNKSSNNSKKRNNNNNNK